LGDNKKGEKRQSAGANEHFIRFFSVAFLGF
jgi:hypothetical protein